MKADKRKYLFKLKPGRYFFKVQGPEHRPLGAVEQAHRPGTPAMRRPHTAAVLAALLVTPALVVVSSQPAAASTCTRTWANSTGTPENFEDPTKWSPNGIPGDLPNEVICIPDTTDTVAVNSNGKRFFHLKELHIAGTSDLEIGPGVGLYVDGGDDSVWGPGTSVAITKAEVGGSGTIRAQGTVSFTSGGPDATFLSSTKEGVAATRLPPTRVNWWSRATPP